MSKNKTSEYFQLYIDFADTVNYYRGQMYVGLDELDGDLGNTAGFQFTGTIARRRRGDHPRWRGAVGKERG
jgi:hypothetical protein